MQTFRISLIQQFIMLFHLILVNTLMLVGFVYLFGTIYPDNLFIYFYAFMFFFNIFPTLFLHIKYYLKNKGAKLSIDPQLEKICYEQSNVSLQYNFNDIKIIERVASYGKGTGWYSFAEYRYYKIIFNDGVYIVITCLMVHDIDNVLKKLFKKESEKKLKVLATI